MTDTLSSKTQGVVLLLGTCHIIGSPEGFAVVLGNTFRSILGDLQRISTIPASHSVMAGAAATMLKAFFNDDFVIPNPVIPNANGKKLISYNDPELTISGNNQIKFIYL